jgi:CheY-like chemotaxis protein/Tfp pilus assembly protein PilZ
MEGRVQKKIILADDNKTFLMYAGLLLKRFGMQVFPAQNGLEALKMIKTMPPDLIMLDVHMGTFDGVATLRHIKTDRELEQIPVIMISQDISPETVDRCKDLGCSDYLFKPINVDRLHESIQKAFFADGGRQMRKYIRTAYNKQVSVYCSSITYDLYAETLSGGGVYVRKEKPLPIGCDVYVTLHLETGGTLQFRGKVIYTKEAMGDFSTLPAGMAIQFCGLSEQEHEDMSNYLKTLVAGDILEEQQEKVLEHWGDIHPVI